MERAKERQEAEKDLLDVEEEEEQGSEEDSSEYEEYSDSEDEVGPRWVLGTTLSLFVYFFVLSLLVVGTTICWFCHYFLAVIEILYFWLE